MPIKPSPSRKRPREPESDGDYDEVQRLPPVASPSSNRSKLNNTPAKGQMSLLSFGFTSAAKRLASELSSSQDSGEPSGTNQTRSSQSSNGSFTSPVSQPRPPRISQLKPPGGHLMEPQNSNSDGETYKSSSSTPTKLPETPPKKTVEVHNKTPLKQSTRSINVDSPSRNATQTAHSIHAHTNYKFLKPENRLDINMRRPDDPDYDEKTLYIPPAFLKQETPALRQWWSIKQRNMDAILFFKMGKFYELFNEDAVIGVNHLDLNYMKSHDDRPAHAGFPEVAYDKFAKKLVEKGFKVMRIEQTETPAMLEERAQKTGIKSGDRVVMREICQVTTRGTEMLNINDSVFRSPLNHYLLALNESIAESSNAAKASRLFGVCFVDVTIGKIYLGQFKDDYNLSNLNILLAHHTPTEILYERNNLSTDSYKTLLKTGARLAPLRQSKEFWPIKKALSHLKVNQIFSDSCGDFEWPSDLKKFFEDGENAEEIISLEPCDDFKYALDSFGAIVYYLQSQLIAKQVLACAPIEIYTTPLQGAQRFNQQATSTESTAASPPMVMDHVALRNLEIFLDSSGNDSPTLFSSINHCCTHFGQRLLKDWLCSPLCDIPQIEKRLEAVEALMSNKNASLMNEIAHMLKNTPDLERMLSKIKNHCYKSESDTRAVMFDGNQYNKAKVSAFVILLNNFKRIQNFIKSVSRTAENCESQVLKRLLSFTTDGGLFPDYDKKLKYFDKAFDQSMAQKTGTIIPAEGINLEYDECEAEMRAIKQRLDDYLEEQKSVLKCKKLEYFGSAKNRYQLQVPEEYVKKVPDDWRIESGRKGFKRFYTPKIDKYFARLTCLEEQMKRILNGVLAKIFEMFLRSSKLWSSAIDCVAILDVLQSMAKFSRSMIATGVDICKPEFVTDGEPIIDYTSGRHPVLVRLKSDFISNNLKLDSRTLLLSGANMGGKSTLMRQTALLVILAQIGTYVPAIKFKFTPVDRIFSRLGASDRIMEGESTFYTELVETSAMLRCATRSSLLLLDELGRGTSTFDGTAIAYSVMEEISTNMKCRCIFSTHYHTLTRDFMNTDNVRLAHMACKIERDDNVDELNMDPLKENITFLYKIADGPAARSYGYNVAKLAGIQNSLIAEAFQKSKEIELSCKVLASMQRLCLEGKAKGPSTELRSLIVEDIKV